MITRVPSCALLLTIVLLINEKTWIAKADLHNDSSPLSVGTLTFTQANVVGSPVRVTGTLTNLEPNTRYHGFHVHMFALPDDIWDCSQAGAHWNPYASTISPVTRVLWPFDLNTNDLNNIYKSDPVNSPSYVPSPVSQTAIHLRSSLQQSVTIIQPFLNFARISFTVKCWIYPTSLSVYDNTILSQCQNQPTRICLQLGLRNATLFMGLFEDYLKGKTVLKANNWYHVAYVFDAASLQQAVYLNGKQDAMRKASNSYQGTEGILTIGTSKSSRIHQTYFDGYIDQLSFVSLVKSVDEIWRDATTINIPSVNCDAQMAIIQQQAKTIEQQILTTNNLWQSSMETVSSIWEQQHQGIYDVSPPSGIHIWKRTETSIYDFRPPNKLWCPWRADCTQVLDQNGQMTIEMDQMEPLPFELRASISNNPTNDTYVVHLYLDHHRAQISKTVNGQKMIINQTNDYDCVLYNEKVRGNYWLSIDYSNLFVKYGQGEVRDRCTVLRSDIPSNESNHVRQIQFVHISLNNSRDIAKLKQFEYKVKLKLGRNPVVYDPPLIVVSPKNYDLNDYRDKATIPVTRLDPPCQALYHDVIHWRFQDDEFPHLFEAIEQSVRNESGWCRKRLIEKANRFGKSNILATYLRITVGLNRGTSPGVPFVVEIWPPGHYSPIHAHANTYGIIRVLNGAINVKLYQTLYVKRQKPFYQINIATGQVTWLSPGLNQIHKLENITPNQTCITIQAYEYRSDEVSNYEFFDYINNDGNEIRRFDPVSDIDYFQFKKIMMDEWNNKL
ncbi:unnamed protein product [Rotaria sp. Silwood1]|nr:unnamed protein product [Rotaria sp. Silwood1]CAF1236726.1 unnamed protein product [Rotaria sp. Silwood1]